MTKKLQLTAKGAEGTKTFTIPNPVAEDDFDATAVTTFINEWNDTCDTGTGVALTSAKYITTSETVVYPAA